MGYTHYFKQQKALNQDQWDTLSKEVSVILDNVIRVQGVVLESNDPDNGLLVTEERICFNGDSLHDLDHETFYLEKWYTDFNFCKTARKPYDLAVVACLILINKRFPNYFDIGSDGSAKDWLKAKALVETLFEESFDLPESL